MPERTCVPPLIVNAPDVPDITPEYVVLPFVIVNALAPSVTPPAPDRVTIDAPLVVPLMLKVPAFDTSLEDAIDPEPDKVNVPALMVVVPV